MICADPQKLSTVHSRLTVHMYIYTVRFTRIANAHALGWKALRYSSTLYARVQLPAENTARTVPVRTAVRFERNGVAVGT